mmetsp:Transcript_1736/g.3096  ORF Transcript_1736/g.3096 Transcript_1736/m.3096 type:complete len:260 (+) Transcript_1736:673-1452(+)
MIMKGDLAAFVFQRLLVNELLGHGSFAWCFEDDEDILCSFEAVKHFTDICVLFLLGLLLLRLCAGHIPNTEEGIHAPQLRITTAALAFVLIVSWHTVNGVSPSCDLCLTPLVRNCCINLCLLVAAIPTNRHTNNIRLLQLWRLAQEILEILLDVLRPVENREACGEQRKLPEGCFVCHGLFPFIALLPREDNRSCSGRQVNEHGDKEIESLHIIIAVLCIPDILVTSAEGILRKSPQCPPSVLKIETEHQQHGHDAQAP